MIHLDCSPDPKNAAANGASLTRWFFLSESPLPSLLMRCAKSAEGTRGYLHIQYEPYVRKDAAAILPWSSISTESSPRSRCMTPSLRYRCGSCTLASP